MVILTDPIRQEFFKLNAGFTDMVHGNCPFPLVCPSDDLFLSISENLVCSEILHEVRA